MTRVNWAGTLLRTTLALVPLIWGGPPAYADTPPGQTGASSTAREAGATADSSAAANNTATRTVIPTPTRRPIAFEENRGQADPNVKFIARSSTYTLFLTPREAILSPRTASNAMVRMHLDGGAKSPKVAGVDALPGKVYYANPEAKGRLTPAATFRRVHYTNVYPGIDLEYYGNDEALEFDFTLAPQADPNQIRLSFDGARSVTVGKEGELRLQTSADDLVLKAPIVYQERDGVRRHITGRYVVSNRRKGEVRFALGAYDRSLPLVIDPTIVYATYSGTAGSESISAIQVNKRGQVYLFGSTTALPSLGSPAVRIETATTDPIYTPLYCLVSKLSSDAQDVVFQVYFQGFRECQAFTVGPSGHVHLAMRAPYAFGGFTQLRTLSGDDDSGNAGAMMLSGLNFDQVTAIPGRPYLVRDMKADSSGNVYVLYQQLVQGDAALQSRLAKVNSVGELIDGTTGIGLPFDIGLYELGAGFGDVAVAMALDEFGQVFVIGDTHGEFPTTPNAFQTQSSAALSTGDVFLAQVDTAQFPWQIPYATLAGGDSHDAALGIARDPLGFIYLTGRTSSFNFPMASSAFQGSPNLTQGEGDGFILKLDLNQSGEDQLVAGTFLGLPQFGPGFGWRNASNPLVVLPGGELAITGITSGTLLVNELFQGGLVRAANPFIAIFSAEADALVMGTRLDSIDEATHSLIQGNGVQALISVIETTEPGRGTAGVDQPTLVGGVDLLVSKFDLSDVLANRPPTLDLGPDRALITETTVFDFDLANAPHGVGDHDGLIEKFTWRIDGGAPLVFTPPFSATFPLPLGRHVLTLAVTDNRGATVDDTLVVDVEQGLSNGDPLVDAGPDTSRVATSPTGATVALFGRVSDPDNDILTITWTGNFPTIQFEVRPPYFSGNAAVFARLPIGVTEATLTVNDGHGHVASDTTIFTLAGTNTAAGAAIEVTVQDDRVTEYNGFTPGRLELTFDAVTVAGLTWMRTRTDQLPPPSAGKQLGSAPSYYDVTSTAAGTGNVRVCIDTTGMSFRAAQAARLHRLNGTAWDDIALTSTPAESAAHYVCGATSFFTTATFALFTAADESMRVTTILDDLTFSDGVAVDPARQYLYVAHLSEVRRIDLQTQANIRIAGNGSTDLSEIRYNVDALDTAFFASGSMAVDQAGNIYVPDLNGCGLVRLEPRSNFTSYFLTRVAGTGPDPVTLACGYGGDGGAAIDADVTVAGGITFDRGGNMFFVQNGYASGNVLRRITPGADGVVGGAADEIITTIAGEGTTWPPGGNPHEVYFGGSLGSLTFSPQGDLYLGLSSQIGRLTPAPDAQVIDGRPGEVITSVSGGGILLTPPFQGDGGPAMNAEWNNARSIALQPNGDLIVADSGLNRLRRITAGADGIVNGGADERVSTFAGFSENLPDIPFNGDGYALSTAFSSPRVVLNDPRGGLVVADVGHNRLRRIGLGAVTGSGADLGVTLTASPNSIDAGSTVTYTATVTNGGPSTATGIAVSMPVPGGYAAWAQSPAGFCIVPILHFAGTVLCDGGSLLSGQSLQITITLTPPVRGTLASTVTASSATSDPVPDNNSRTVVVEALDRIAPTAVISAPSPVAVGTSLTASAVGSTDAGGGQIASYQWTLIERGVTIETTVPAVTFTVTPAEPLSVGPYTIQLVIFDDSGNASVSAVATVLVVVPASLTASNDSYTVTRDSTLVSGHRLVTKFPATSIFDNGPLRTLANVNGTLFFIERCNLRKSDGTAARTVLVKNICGNNLTTVNGTLFFAGQDSRGKELWKSDGTEAGTVLVKDIVPGSTSSSPRELTNVDGQLFFIVDIIAEGEVAGSELWRSDGTDSGTTMVKAFPGRGGAFFPRNVSGTLYFRVLPDGLWRSDGTTAGTVRIKNIRVDGGVPDLAFPHFFPWFPDWPVSINGKYAFFGRVPVDKDIWASDPVDGAVRLLEMNAETGHDRVLLDLAAAGDRLYFGVIDVTIRPEDWAACLANAGEQFCLLQPPYSGTREIWTSDGTPAGTTLLKVFGPFSSQAITDGPFFFTASGNSVYFLQGSGLWNTDGSEAGTTLVKAAQARSGSPFAGTSDRMTDVNGTLFFSARHLGLSGLWKSDGTEAGTVPVESVQSGYGPVDFTNVNGAFFFTIPYDDARDRELWVAGAAANVLANDILQTPQPVTATIVQPVSQGTLAFNPDGTFIYRPNPGFSGDDTFTYTVTDGTITSNPATVTIHVTTLPATISITNAEVVEGNGGTANLVFTITRSGLDLSASASVDFATADGSATAGADYVHQSGTVTFAPDETSKQVSVPAIGDTSDEGNEVFFLNLGNAAGAAIARTRAYGTIVNDDVEADLQVAVTAPSLVGAGGTIRYTVVITNNGPAPATLVGMSLPVSAAQLLGVSATSPAGFCLVPVLFLVPAGTVFCPAGTLAPHASITVTVDATLRANPLSNTVVATFSVGGHESDPVPDNNTHTVETEVEPSVDLLLVPLAPALTGTVTVGVPASFRMTVTNVGGAAAQVARLTVHPPAGLQFVSASMPGAVCDFIGFLVCDIDNFAPGASVEAVVVVTPLASGPVTATFTVSSPHIDLNPANNGITFDINRAPFANAGADQNIAINPTTGQGEFVVTSDGSSDPDGDPLVLTWSRNGEFLGNFMATWQILAVGNYVYTLTATDGRGGVAIDTVEVTVHGTGLAPPTNVSAQATAPGSVTISWNPVPGASGYRILRSPDPVTFQIPHIDPPLHAVVGSPATFDVTGTSTVDSGLPTLVRQYYAVQATNGSIVSLPAPAQGGEVLVTAAPDAEIFGVADFHNHQFANLGFGRSLISGNAFSPAGILDALPSCEAIHGSGGLLDLLGNIRTNPPGSFPVPVPITVPSMTFTPPNQAPMTTPSFPLLTSGHFTGGIAASNGISFDGWPRWNSITHQQVYYEWLRRAFDGGLRLMVMHALNNQLLCQISGTMNQTLGNFSCNDMDNIDDQLNMAKSLEAFIDGQSGGTGKGWYRIAYSATDARHIINSGKMAVILGIEVDDLFGCSLPSACTEQFVRDRLNHYYDMGVRHLFPVHAFDNAFGGTALFDPLFDLGNRLVEGQFVVRRECGPEGLRLQGAAQSAGGAAAAPGSGDDGVCGGLQCPSAAAARRRPHQGNDGQGDDHRHRSHVGAHGRARDAARGAVRLCRGHHRPQRIDVGAPGHAQV